MVQIHDYPQGSYEKRDMKMIKVKKIFFKTNTKKFVTVIIEVASKIVSGREFPFRGSFQGYKKWF